MHSQRIGKTATNDGWSRWAAGVVAALLVLVGLTACGASARVASPSGGFSTTPTLRLPGAPCRAGAEPTPAVTSDGEVAVGDSSCGGIVHVKMGQILVVSLTDPRGLSVPATDRRYQFVYGQPKSTDDSVVAPADPFDAPGLAGLVVISRFEARQRGTAAIAAEPSPACAADESCLSRVAPFVIEVIVE